VVAADTWLTAMKRGDFSHAWEISDRVLADRVASGPCWEQPRHQQWIWDGRPLADRTVLVHCYHGLGDTIQFARFLPLIQQVACGVIVWAQPALVPLLRTLPDAMPVLSLHDGTPAVVCDADIEIMEIPHALRMTLETLPAAVPYFSVTPAPRLSDRFSIGVVAEAGNWDARRSVPADRLASLANCEGVAVFSLQLGRCVPGLPDAGSPDVLTLAERIRALDLVITVDTMVAHLAGSLGVPTWTLLPAQADWRWQEKRTDSPWYPTMRLFRQSQVGNWEPVLEEIRAGLACVR
jgi:hypothetical protein